MGRLLAISSGAFLAVEVAVGPGEVNGGIEDGGKGSEDWTLLAFWTLLDGVTCGFVGATIRKKEKFSNGFLSLWAYGFRFGFGGLGFGNQANPPGEEGEGGNRGDSVLTKIRCPHTHHE